MAMSFKPLFQINKTQLADLAEVSPSVLSRLHWDAGVSLATVGKFCAALNVPVQAIVRCEYAQEPI